MTDENLFRRCKCELSLLLPISHLQLHELYSVVDRLSKRDKFIYDEELEMLRMKSIKLMRKISNDR